jgi:hypothetical protein
VGGVTLVTSGTVGSTAATFSFVIGWNQLVVRLLWSVK